VIQIHLVDLVILISVVQSLFLSLIIIQKYRSSLANKTLSLLFLAYALVMLEMILWDIQYQYKYPHFVLLFTGTPFLIGPFHYLYTIYLSHYSPKFKKIHLLHFIPFILFELSMLPVLFESKEQLIQNITYTESGDISVVSLILNWLIMFHIVIYTVLVIAVTRKYTIRIKNIFSSVDNIRLGWLRNITILFSMGIVMYIIENTLNTSGVISNKFMISSFVTPVVIYVLGYLAILKSEIYASLEFNRQIDQISDEEQSAVINEDDGNVRKYQKSGLNPEKAKEYLNNLLQIMETEKPYLNSDLTLSRLADLISIPPHNLSEVINTQLGQSFFDFINKYRVEKIKGDIIDPSKNNFTLLAIAMEAGFNSKSSFNNIFKKHTGMTPSEYKKNHTPD
jgi:AraC-like DNA-binding protein